MNDIGSNKAIKLLAVQLTKFPLSSIFLDSDQLKTVKAALTLVEISISEIQLEIYKNKVTINKNKKNLLTSSLASVNELKNVLDALLNYPSATSNVSSSDTSTIAIANISIIADIIRASGKKIIKKNVNSRIKCACIYFD